jgi:nitrate reductase gamma subunit
MVNQLSIYNFLTGPALWTSFLIFLGGLIVRIAWLFKLSRRKDQVFYNHASLSWGFKSILYWIVPWGSASMRQQPIFTFMVFAFHITLLAVPLFLNAHNILWDEAFGISLWSMPNQWADVMTVIALVAIIFLAIRRMVRREVRILTGAWDYILIGITALPFLTGLLAYHQLGPYETMMIAHVIAGELLLILIPFTKLGHMILFFFTRAFIGFEMGGRRGARSW